MTLANAKSNIKSGIAKLARKSTFTKSLLAAAGAGALLLSAPAKSDAQVAFSAAFGGPVAVAPAYDPYYYNYWAQRRAYIEHQEWLRAHRYYDRDYYYDRDRDRDRDRYYDRDRWDHDRDDHDRYDRDRR